MPRAIVLSLNQLSRRCLGCYGHEWIETPNLDRLASRSVVFDQCFASPASAPLFGDAISHLQRTGISVRRLCEAEAADADGGDDVDQTSLARLMSQAERALVELSDGSEASWLLWLESRGIGWPGVATAQFVELYADELDDVPQDLVSLREIEVAYAALLTQFDHLLGRLLATIERLFGDARPLLVVMAEHGQAVGEAEMLSPFANRPSESLPNTGSFRDELVHAPLLIAGAATDSLGSRRSELVTPADVWPTLSDWLGCEPITGDDRDPRSLLPLLQNRRGDWRSELLLQDDDGGVALRTEEFFYIQTEASPPCDEGELPGSLFLKPEDAWEVNDVAAQYPDQVANLRTTLQHWLNAQQTQKQRPATNPERP